jgi:hypothetical protein
MNGIVRYPITLQEGKPWVDINLNHIHLECEAL